ncbi:MAG: alpha-galactosidase, partial [Bacteroidia bacterium]
MKELFSIIIFLTTGLSLIAQDPVGPPPGAQQQIQQTPAIIIPLDTKNTSLVFRINNRDGRLYQAYFGPKLSNTDNLVQTRDAGHLAYATFGTDNLFEPAIRATHNDGNPSLELKYVSNEVENIRPDVTLTRIFLKNPEYPFVVTLFIRTFTNEDIIEQWTEIKHDEKKPVTIFNYASSMLHFDAEKYWLTQFHGDWAEEMRLQESELTAGIKILDTKLGTRAHMYQTPVFMLSLNEKSDENKGQVIAGTIGWSGNFRFLFEVDEKGSLRV